MNVPLQSQPLEEDTRNMLTSLYILCQLTTFICRWSEEHNHHGGLNSCGVLNNLYPLCHKANQQKKEKVRIIYIFLQVTQVACVHLAIYLSVLCWCFYIPALETYPSGNRIFKIARFTLNAGRFLRIMWPANVFFLQTGERQCTQNTCRGERLAPRPKWGSHEPAHTEGPAHCLSKWGNANTQVFQ